MAFEGLRLMIYRAGVRAIAEMRRPGALDRHDSPVVLFLAAPASFVPAWRRVERDRKLYAVMAGAGNPAAFASVRAQCAQQ
jgi:hypothetical protein